MPFSTCIVTQFLTYKWSQLNSLLWRPSQEWILENLSDFSRRFKSLSKIHQRFKYWIYSRIFKYSFVGNLMLVQLIKLFMISQASHMQKLGIFGHIKAPILIFKVKPVLNKLEKSITAGAHPSAALSEQRHRPCWPCSDHDRCRSATLSFTTSTTPAAAHAACANLLRRL
jgi:hypothetical protein